MTANDRAIAPAVSVVVPTRGRPKYLEVTLRSLAAQDISAPYEIIVVDDGSTDRTPEVAAAAGVRLVRHPTRRSLNAARNTGIAEARAELIAFVDDDVEAPPGWLRALHDGATRFPDVEAFGGPIRPRFEGVPPRGCGRDSALITCIDLGPHDCETDYVWGANLAVRRAAVERAGLFDEGLTLPSGDEAEWLDRLRDAGGTVVYLASAGLDHRRAVNDSRLRALAPAAYTRGRAARAEDRRRGREPHLARELRVLGGCCWHTLYRRCPRGFVMTAHAVGRVVEAIRER